MARLAYAELPEVTESFIVKCLAAPATAVGRCHQTFQELAVRTRIRLPVLLKNLLENLLQRNRGFESLRPEPLSPKLQWLGDDTPDD